MAPEVISKWLEMLPSGATVLDPMCGSGVVLRQSLAKDFNAVGYDMDPLAVLMSRVWTTVKSLDDLPRLARSIASDARKRRIWHSNLWPLSQCSETLSFVEYWFDEPQRTALARISYSLQLHRNDIPRHVLDGLLLALSKTIITKQAGASLAWDVSHSRPHRKIENNEFDVERGFVRAADQLAEIMGQNAPGKAAVVHRGDCRKMGKTRDASVDALITSPPYLNAIDYLRGHKLALVWMGFTIPALRQLRANAVGSENTRGKTPDTVAGLKKILPDIENLPRRQQRIVYRYADDSLSFLRESKRVIKPGGKLVLVLADSIVRGVEVSSSSIFRWAAKNAQFELRSREVRQIPHDKRYLPITSNGNALDRRMRNEIIQVFQRVA
jgi:SAM-dependent methyltransferase